MLCKGFFRWSFRDNGNFGRWRGLCAIGASAESGGGCPQHADEQYLLTQLSFYQHFASILIIGLC